MGYVLEHADVELVVCEDQEQTDKVLQVASRLPLLRRIVMMETKGLRSYAPAERGRIVTFAEVEADGAGREAAELAALNIALDAQSLDDTGLMIYTSGSTGKPKGAMLSYRNMRGRAPVLSAPVPCGRADAVDLRAALPGLPGELRRIHPHGAGRPARGGAHHFPGRAAHLGKTARVDIDQDAGSRAPAAMVVPPGVGGMRAVPGEVARAVHRA
ncbi:hypothetical protein G6F65_019379 [Rhizopus arrhizus]|nr:hypothetical protein G6F65_019379 [Rhizopus arrhizus]